MKTLTRAGKRRFRHRRRESANLSPSTAAKGERPVRKASPPGQSTNLLDAALLSSAAANDKGLEPSTDQEPQIKARQLARLGTWRARHRLISICHR